MNGRQPTPEELRIIEFYRQLRALSDDPEIAATIVLLAPNSRLVQSCSLSASDLEAATDALASLNAAKKATEATTRPDAGLPEVDADDINAIVSGFESLLRGDGGPAS